MKVNVPAVVALPVLPKTWNFAEEVALPPMDKSSVILAGATTPLFLCQKPLMVAPELAMRLLTYKLFQ